MSKSSLKQNILSNRFANREAISRVLSANQPAHKKQVKEMEYVDTIPLIKHSPKVAMTASERKELKEAMKLHKASLRK